MTVHVVNHPLIIRRKVGLLLAGITGVLLNLVLPGRKKKRLLTPYYE